MTKIPILAVALNGNVSMCIDIISAARYPDGTGASADNITGEISGAPAA